MGLLRQATYAALGGLFLLALLPSPVVSARAASPPALPSDRLHFGITNGDASWITASGVPFRYRYEYLAGGVYNSWTAWNSPAGQYVTNYVQDTPSGTIPVLTYYMLLQSHRASDEATDDFNNLNSPSLMSAYYSDFRLLMQKAGAQARPVVVHVEPDLWGYLQQRSNNSTADTVTASVASSGMADVQGFANSVAGFGRALIHLRDLYAPNVVISVHASMWSSGVDIATTTSAGVDPVAEADKTAAFLTSSGPWDAVFNDVDDHDAAWWEAQGADGAASTHWWDTANQRFPNFSRYRSWVAELRARTGLPQVAWQVPEGNQYFLAENNSCGHYQDNRAQYFITHAAELFSAGLVAVLFGAGNSCQTRHDDAQNDGITNNGGAPTSDLAGGCSACNTHVSTLADDDGGLIRTMVGGYYAGGAGGCASGGRGTNGYNILTAFGGIYSFGSACYWGNLLDHGYPGPATGLAETADGRGYAILTAAGGIYTFGNASYFGNLIDHRLPGPAVALAMTPGGGGYAILTSFGGVYTFGDAQYFGNLIDHGYPGRAVSLSYTPSGRGYAILTDSGAIYTFGDAQYAGNLLDHGYPGPASSLAYTASGQGYSLLTSWGGIYSFGDARYYGNLVDHWYPGPAVALANTP